MTCDNKHTRQCKDVNAIKHVGSSNINLTFILKRTDHRVKQIHITGG